MPANDELVDDFADSLFHFVDETKLSDLRLLALLQRINLRLLFLGKPNEFDLSTDWSPRLLHSNLVLGCLTKFRNDKRLMSNAYSASEALKRYTHPTTKGGVHLVLQPEMPVAAFTYSTSRLCLPLRSKRYKECSREVMGYAKDAINACNHIDEFDPDFGEVFRAAGNFEMHSLRSRTPSENFENPLFFPEQDRSLPAPSLYSSENKILPEGFPAQQFWSDWIKGIIDGEPLDWGLQLEVGLISKADWKIGIEHVTHKIEVIHKRWELEAEIESLREQLQFKATQPRTHRLHNQPPEPILDISEHLRYEVQFVVRQLDDLKGEISGDFPSSSVILRIATSLLEAAKRLARYWGSLGDTALQSTAKWAGPAFAASLAAPEGIQRVSQLASSFAKLLGN